MYLRKFKLFKQCNFWKITNNDVRALKKEYKTSDKYLQWNHDEDDYVPLSHNIELQYRAATSILHPVLIHSTDQSQAYTNSVC